MNKGLLNVDEALELLRFGSGMNRPLKLPLCLMQRE